MKNERVGTGNKVTNFSRKKSTIEDNDCHKYRKNCINDMSTTKNY